MISRDVSTNKVISRSSDITLNVGPWFDSPFDLLTLNLSVKAFLEKFASGTVFMGVDVCVSSPQDQFTLAYRRADELNQLRFEIEYPADAVERRIWLERIVSRRGVLLEVTPVSGQSKLVTVVKPM